MYWLSLWFTTLSRRLAALGLCTNSGMIAGLITGGILSILHHAHALFGDPIGAVTARDLLIIALMLLSLCWLCLMFALVILGRLQFRSVALPALFTAAVVVGLTVWLTERLSLWAWSWLVGLIIGFLVGFALCQAGRLSTGVRSHGV
jgi:hypothetical protein